jgi:solute carrier family 1 (high affinity glutamate transporter) protein 1
VGGWEGFLPELIKLGWYASTVIVGLLIHGLITLPIILMVFAKQNVLTYASNMLTAQSIAFSTSSSSATLPVTLEGVEKNGVSERTGSFVLPLGATINMDGTALYEAVAAVFIAQVYGITLGPVEQVIIFLTATLAAIGAAGIPQAGLVTMVIVLKAVGLPIEGIILVIDWFLDRCRTTINVWGDAVGAAVVERYETQS